MENQWGPCSNAQDHPAHMNTRKDCASQNPAWSDWCDFLATPESSLQHCSQQKNQAVKVAGVIAEGGVARCSWQGHAHTHTYRQSRVPNSPHVFLDFGRKLQNPERTHIDTRRTGPRARMEPTTFLLQGNSTTHCSARVPKGTNADKG